MVDWLEGYASVVEVKRNIFTMKCYPNSSLENVLPTIQGNK